MTPARVLFVCTGNVCRSPFAERLLVADLRAAGIGADEVAVTSAGTHALVGEPIAAPMQRFLTRYGADPDGFVARLLEPSMVEGADVVLALTRRHRGVVAQMYPRATRYTFTLRELVRLIEVGEPALELPDGPRSQRLRTLVPQLAARRGTPPPPRDPSDYDVTDPYGRDGAVYERSIDEMLPGIDALSRTLTAQPRSGHTPFVRAQ